MTDPAWLSAARRDIGNKESLGPNDSPWIRRILASLSGMWLLGQPWCGGAVAYWFSQCGISLPKNWFRAKAWLDWGIPLAAPAVGCVVVFEREGGGHVGLVVGRDTRGRLLVLGGNQGDAVSIAPFDPARVAGFRWPADQAPALTGYNALPIQTAAGASSSNEA